MAISTFLSTAGPLFSLGGLMLIGVACGAIARLLRLPTLTGYIAAGILCGHHGLDMLSQERLGSSIDLGSMLTDPVNDLAMALVLFVLGGQFKFRGRGAKAAPTLWLSLIEAGFTCFAVTLLTWPVLGSFIGATLLGIMAVAIAPATTLVVLDEYKAEGTTTETIKLLTALSNVWAVALFEIALLLFFANFGGTSASSTDILWDFVGSLSYGLIAGTVLVLLQERASSGSYSVPLLTTLLITIGVCKATGVPHMLAFLATGAVVANRSRFFEPIVANMGAYARPAFVLFFVMSGMHLDFSLFAEPILVIAALVYVLARLIGKVVGARVGLHFSQLNLPSLSGKGSPPLGLGLLCQAGAAIALAHYAGTYDPLLGDQLLNIVLGAVVVFELLGPLLLRHVAIAAGEVKLGHLLVHGHRQEHTSWSRALIRTIRGRGIPSDRLPEDIGVERIMRHSPDALNESDDLDEVLRFANHSRYNHFPVNSNEGQLIGLINLDDVEELAYDRRMAHLISAADLFELSIEECSLPASSNLNEARVFFSTYPGNTCAIINNSKDRQLVGMLERAEVMRTCRSLATPAP